MNVKVVVIGNQRASKSSLVKCLQEEGNWFFGRLSNVTVAPDTAGVIPYLYQRKSLEKFLLYDFAGHSEYYTSHSVVIEHATFSCETLFILVVDLRYSLTDFKNQVEYWISFLLSSSKNFIKLVIVGSYKDCTTDNQIEAKSKVIGWCIKCCQCDSVSTFFIPRFVQVLQLRIASQLALEDSPHKTAWKFCTSIKSRM